MNPLSRHIVVKASGMNASKDSLRFMVIYIDIPDFHRFLELEDPEGSAGIFRRKLH